MESFNARLTVQKCIYVTASNNLNQYLHIFYL